MNKTLVVVALMLGMVAGCARKDKIIVEESRAEVIKSIQAVEYHRTAGAAGAEDKIVIAQDGTIKTSGRTIGNTTSKLSQFQMMQLARVFNGWEKLKESYPAAQDGNAATTTLITFGKKTVTACDGAKDVPESFLVARQKLEAIARDLPAMKKEPGAE